MLVESFGFFLKCTVMSFSLNDVRVLRLVSKLPPKQDGAWERKVVLDLMACLPQEASYHVYMDNYFTSFHLLEHLGEHNIHATGVLNKKKLVRHYFRQIT